MHHALGTGLQKDIVTTHFLTLMFVFPVGVILFLILWIRGLLLVLVTPPLLQHFPHQMCSILLHSSVSFFPLGKFERLCPHQSAARTRSTVTYVNNRPKSKDAAGGW